MRAIACSKNGVIWMPNLEKSSVGQVDRERFERLRVQTYPDVIGDHQDAFLRRREAFFTGSIFTASKGAVSIALFPAKTTLPISSAIPNRIGSGILMRRPSFNTIQNG